MKLSKTNVQQLHTICDNEHFVCLFSGGKDCGIALALACKSGKPISLIHCIENDISSNHNQKIDVIKKQATAIGLPIKFITCDMKEKQYIYHLTKALKCFELNDVKSLVTGTLYDLHAYRIYSSMCSFASMTLRQLEKNNGSINHKTILNLRAFLHWD